MYSESGKYLLELDKNVLKYKNGPIDKRKWPLQHIYDKLNDDLQLKELLLEICNINKYEINNCNKSSLMCDFEEFIKDHIEMSLEKYDLYYNGHNNFKFFFGKYAQGYVEKFAIIYGIIKYNYDIYNSDDEFQPYDKKIEKFDDCLW